MLLLGQFSANHGVEKSAVLRYTSFDCEVSQSVSFFMHLNILLPKAMKSLDILCCLLA